MRESSGGAAGDQKRGLIVKAFYAGVKHLMKLSPEIIWEAQSGTDELVGLVGKENAGNASYLLMAVFDKAQYERNKLKEEMAILQAEPKESLDGHKFHDLQVRK